MKTPEVRIYFSWLLYQNESIYLDKQLRRPGDSSMISEQKCRDFAANYRNEWAKYQSKILSALMQVLNLEFYMPVIDVACAPWFKAQSEPITMSFYYYPDQFVDVLTHELCHVLLTDNNVYSIRSSRNEVALDEWWSKLFSKHELVTTVHIPVHALCKYVYLDILKEPSRLERDMQDVKGNKPYVEAWEYVNTHDYKEIIELLKQDYKEIAKLT